MKKEGFEISPEVDAVVLQYAAEKKFKKQHWYWSMPVRVAALFAVAAGLGAMQYFNRPAKADNTLVIAEHQEPTALDWSDFEEKLEYLNDEVIAEAKYLAQL